jgi:hypothetical protein
MIYLPKSQPAPECLAIESKKKNGNYNCGNVLQRLCDDFKGKCYICEDDVKSIQIEHFIPHENINTDLKFNWNNLFYACNYCNNLKGTDYKNILNCTVESDSVETSIKYQIEPFPNEKAIIKFLSDTEKVKNTVRLLNEIYNTEVTENKRLGSAALRKRLIEELQFFGYLLSEYELNPKENLKRLISEKLKKSSKFTAFKHWIIKDNPTYFQEFQSYLN